MDNVATHQSMDINEIKKRSSTGKHLIGLPVIALDNGERQGDIHDVVYNPLQGKLVGFVVQRGGGLFSSGEAFWLAPEQIHALGEDAVTIDNAAMLRPAQGSVSEVEEDAGEPVLGKRLMTEGGKFLGNVDDVFVERSTFRVVAYEVSGGLWQDMMRGQTAVPVDHVLSIGADVAIVPDFVQQQIDQPTGGLLGATESAKEKLGQARTEVATAIENKEADYVRGKTAGRELRDDTGNLIVGAGETIGDTHIQRAVAAGKMHALATAAGQAQASGIAERVKEGAANAGTAVREKAADLGEAAQDKQAELLIGKTTGRPVLADSGVPLVPANHVVAATDVAIARAAGKLNDLTAAVGTAAFDSVKDRAGDVYDNAKERAGDTYDNAKERAGDAYDNFQERRTEVAASQPQTPAAAPAAPVVVVIEQPVIVREATTTDAQLRQAEADENALVSPAIIVPPGTTRSNG